jgi:pre-mRNA-processing factor 19
MIRLSQARKKRVISDEIPKPEDLKSMKMQMKHTQIHSSTMIGITCMTLDREANRLITGGQDGHLSILDLSSYQVIQTLEGHEGAIISVVYHATHDTLCSSAHDTTVRIWKMDGRVHGFVCHHTLRYHSNTVNGLAYHPSGDYLACSSLDGSWSLVDVERGTLLLRVVVTQDDFSGLQSIQFHPDGLLLATGTLNHQIALWDLKTQSRAASLEGHSSPAHVLAFSENGYHMASASEGEACVQFWDLRKLSCIHSIPLLDSDDVASALSFDESGQFLAIGTVSGSVLIYLVKQWKELTRFKDHANKITSVCFSRNSRSLYTASMDGAIYFYSI